MSARPEPGDRSSWDGASWISRAAARWPTASALETQHTRLGYAELEVRARARAAELVASGVRPGDRIAVWMQNDPDFAALMHASSALGCSLVLLNARSTPGELRPLLATARPALWICSDALRAAAAAAAGTTGPPVRTLEELAALEPGPLPERSASAPPSEADHAVLFTSGTTGIPKGVRLGRRQQEASARLTAARLGLSSRDRWLLCMPLYHVGGLAILIRAALYGSCVVLPPGPGRFEPVPLLRALRDHDISHVSLVPTMLARLLEAAAGEPAPACLRCVLLGGGPIAPELVDRARERGWPLAGTYGLTEAGSGVATSAPGAKDLAWVPALDETRIQILDNDGRALGPYVPGEICVQGPQLMSGYLNRPDDTTRVLRDGWLHTGDIGELDVHGRLRVLDRRTDLIVSGGENVYPAEVEATLLRHPALREAAVIGVPDAVWGQLVVAVVVAVADVAASVRTLTQEAAVEDEPRTDARTTASEAWRAADAMPTPEPFERLVTELTQLCERELAGYKKPRRILWAQSSLPRTASGKLRRDVIRARVVP